MSGRSHHFQSPNQMAIFPDKMKRLDFSIRGKIKHNFPSALRRQFRTFRRVIGSPGMFRSASGGDEEKK